ncbi:MAG: hypothetical protein IIT63_02870 [Prevotella sp.]|nr:hypothetical protein [Prevotella sp.]
MKKIFLIILMVVFIIPMSKAQIKQNVEYILDSTFAKIQTEVYCDYTISRETTIKQIEEVYGDSELEFSLTDEGNPIITIIHKREFGIPIIFDLIVFGNEVAYISSHVISSSDETSLNKMKSLSIRKILVMTEALMITIE